MLARKYAFVFIVITTLSSVRLWAVDMAVPVQIQLPLFLKLMAYDRNLDRVGEEIVVGLVYQEAARESRSVKDNFLSVVDESPGWQLDDIPIRMVTIDIENTDLAQAITEYKIDALYIAPVSRKQLSTVLTVCSTCKIITLTGVPDYINAGLAVGIGLRSDDRPEIIINLTSAKAAGADFSSQLLQLAKIVN